MLFLNGQLLVLLLVICWSSLKSIAADLLNEIIMKIQSFLKKVSWRIERLFSHRSYSLGTHFWTKILLSYISFLNMRLARLYLSQLNLQKKLASSNMKHLLQHAQKLALHLGVTTSRIIISHRFGTKTILIHQRASRKSSAWILRENFMRTFL